MQRVRARFSRILSVLLGGLASRSPRAGFLAADALAAMWAASSRHPNRADLRALFPDLANETATLRRIWRTHARTLLLGGWIRRDRMKPLHLLVRENVALRELRPPMILGTFHIGPTLGLGVLTERLHGETLVLRGTQFPLDRAATPRNVDTMAGTEQQRAATFHRAIERLRADGFVILALDPREAQRISAPFFGGTLQLARGPFAMARIARVPIVPIVARWDGDEIELIVGDALPVANDETALATSAAQWLERYLRESPGELSQRVFELRNAGVSPAGPAASRAAAP
jgi:lauroyl/myristoyl acyltransferase